jgi:hypothetical protein
VEGLIPSILRRPLRRSSFLWSIAPKGMTFLDLFAEMRYTDFQQNGVIAA